MLDFDRFKCLSFDCYGTLIDWETGILETLHPLLERHGADVPDAPLLELYGELEAAEQRRSYRTYREILSGVVVGLGDKLSFRPTLEDLHSLPNSLPGWQPFPDTVDALKRLHTKYKLAIISNIDDDLFAESAKSLQIAFDVVVTAQQARSYKPSNNNFVLALERIGLPREQVLHCGQSLYHDTAPTKALGLANVWVNRPSRRPGAGATKPSAARPDLEVPDMKTLANLALAGARPT
jgi:2-haloacid dehalogenase